jgi:hypothetical protein
MSFMSSIWGGQNQTLNANIAKTGQIGDWSTSQGEGDVTAGTGFFKDILSGDSGKEAAVLAPEMNAAKTGTYQDVKTTAMFNPRSGGTAASTAAIADKLHGYFANLIGTLKGSAADKLTSTGSDLTKTGLSAYGQEIGASQQQMANWSKSIGGHVMISGVQSLEELGEQYLAGPGQTSAADTYSGPGT